MRDLMNYVVSGMEKLDAIGIQYGNIEDVKVNSRAKKRWGQCQRTANGFLIEISNMLLDERSSEDGLMNTILHELLHTIPGCLNHGKKWKAMADKVYNAYGIRIKRLSNAAEKGVAAELEVAKYKYFLRCPDCGKEFRYTRMCETVKHPERYYHTGCKNHLQLVNDL